MIFFPFLYEDELLFSGLARYHQRSGNENYKRSMKELFNSYNICAATILPAQLSILSSRLPAQEAYSSTEFINNNTLFPYYLPFITSEMAVNLLEKINYENGTAIYMSLGKVASSIKSPKKLRYCLECIEEDRNKYGEAFWHRTHQIEGVFVCHKHNSLLLNSTISYAEKRNKHELIPLEKISFDSNFADLTEDISLGKIKFISQQTHSLLNNNIQNLGIDNINNFYLNKLSKQGYITVSGSIRWERLIPEFIYFYGDELLKNVNCSVHVDKKDSWIHRLLRKPRGSIHPLRHILMLGFLGETVSSLADNIKVPRNTPFGDGPWPCLNKAAKHYREKCIISCIITRDYKNGSPVGTFTCDCGFVYSRKGPDRNEADRFRIGRIKAFGPVWEEKLSEVVNMDLSLRKKAALLGVDPMIVKNKCTNSPSKKELLCNTERQSHYRYNWNKILRNHSDLSITEIRKKYSNVYFWLYRYDKEWLKCNYPNLSKKNIRKQDYRRVNWENRDQETVKRVKDIIKEIQSEMSEDEKLVRISKNEIGRRLGRMSFIRKVNLDKMPETKAVIMTKYMFIK